MIEYEQYDKLICLFCGRREGEIEILLSACDALQTPEMRVGICGQCSFSVFARTLSIAGESAAESGAHQEVLPRWDQEVR